MTNLETLKKKKAPGEVPLRKKDCDEIKKDKLAKCAGGKKRLEILGKRQNLAEPKTPKVARGHYLITV